MKYLIVALFVSSAALAADEKSRSASELVAALKEANIQAGYMANRAQVLAADLQAAQDEIKTLQDKLDKATAPGGPK